MKPKALFVILFLTVLPTFLLAVSAWPGYIKPTHWYSWNHCRCHWLVIQKMTNRLSQGLNWGSRIPEFNLINNNKKKPRSPFDASHCSRLSLHPIEWFLTSRPIDPAPLLLVCHDHIPVARLTSSSVEERIKVDVWIEVTCVMESRSVLMVMMSCFVLIIQKSDEQITTLTCPSSILPGSLIDDRLPGNLCTSMHPQDLGMEIFSLAGRRTKDKKWTVNALVRLRSTHAWCTCVNTCQCDC